MGTQINNEQVDTFKYFYVSTDKEGNMESKIN